jgi:ATP-binding cassette, subfamily C, bacterial LapB
LTLAVQQLVTIAIVIGGTYMFDQGEITMGGIIAAVILGGRCVAPFGQFSSVIARSQQSFRGPGQPQQRSWRWRASGPSESRSSPSRSPRGRIEFQSVASPIRAPPIRPSTASNLVIEPGEKVGIIGKIGSGKTTLGRLLSGLYDVSEGSLLIDGIDIRQFHPHEVRRAIGFRQPGFRAVLRFAAR